MSFKISPQELTNYDLLNGFKRYDFDNDGYINKEDMLLTLASEGVWRG